MKVANAVELSHQRAKIIQEKMQERPKKFIDQPFAYHQEVEMEISSLTNMGHGVGRVDGWVVMLPFVIPGERVRAKIFRNHKNYSEADLVEVVTPSPRRVEPPCPLFGRCGGCQYQHIEYELQLEWKRRQVRELLQRMAGIEAETQPVIGSPRQYNYRAKITPHFQRPRKGDTPAIGFLHHGSRARIIDVPHCPIATERINAKLPGIRRAILHKIDGYKRGATILARDSRDGVTIDANAVVSEEVDGVIFRFLAGEFFQNNPFIIDKLTRHARDEAARGNCRFLLDAYCGSGLFCLTASRAFERAAGVEISESAIRWARENAVANGIGNCAFKVGDAAAIFRDVDFPPEQTAVIIDPPRRGSDDAFLLQLFAYKPKRVVYVSCNPATQIRDLKSFVENGYRMETVQPFDLFPQTKHLECVMTLARE